MRRWWIERPDWVLRPSPSLTSALNPDRLSERLGSDPLADAAVAPSAWPTDARETVRRVAGASPFLRRAMARETSFLAAIGERSAGAVLSEIIGALTPLAETPFEPGVHGAALRQGRRRAALLTGVADLGGAWSLSETTAALSLFQEAALEVAVSSLLKAHAASGALAGVDTEQSGYFVLGMGKLGAGELNYSSDIDLIAFYDRSALPDAAHAGATAAFARMTGVLARAFSEPTAEGYVARVDLRLRPDPSATPLCLSTDAAERYYAAMGRTWERAAFIKARPVAGDRVAAEGFLAGLHAFIWRSGVDLAAVEDGSAMLARLRSHKGGEALVVAGQDVKLGAGGIREIEMLVQADQLAFGGREPDLQDPTTLGAVAALEQQGRLPAQTAYQLRAAYDFLRRTEHRLQMIDDQQTHRIPEDPAALDHAAAMMGMESAAAFSAACLGHMTRVRAAAGVQLDPRPGADERARRRALEAFPQPEDAENVVMRWLEGGVPSTRRERARRILARCAPQILRGLSEAPDPTLALRQFDTFLSALPAGVQFFSVVESYPRLLDLLLEICAAAPQLAAALARRPAMFDAVFDPAFGAEPQSAAALGAELSAALAQAEDYERVLDAARRWGGEKRFAVGAAIVKGALAPLDAGPAYSDVAEAAIAALWPHAIAEISRRHGEPPGAGAAVLALGKLGSREMSAVSDVDLIVVYDAPLGAQSSGPKPLYAPQYYARLTQVLTGALSAPTAEGVLYEVDMRLRPSGNSGPLATSLEAFERYQREAAWLWERMALTRARAIAGAAPVAAKATAVVSSSLARSGERPALLAAGRDMRARLLAAHAAKRARPWALKHAAGGLMECELAAQAALLMAGRSRQSAGLTALEAARIAAESGVMPQDCAEALESAVRLQGALAQVLALATRPGAADPPEAPGVKALCVAAANSAQDAAAAALDGFGALEAALKKTQRAAAEAATAFFEEPAP